MEDDSTISIFPQVFRAILRNSPTLIITASLDISGNLSCADLCAGARLTFFSIKKVSVDVWNPRRNTDISMIDGLEACSSGRVIQLYPFDLIQSENKKRIELWVTPTWGTKIFAITTPFFSSKRWPKKVKVLNVLVHFAYVNAFFSVQSWWNQILERIFFCAITVIFAKQDCIFAKTVALDSFRSYCQ